MFSLFFQLFYLSNYSVFLILAVFLSPNRISLHFYSIRCVFRKMIAACPPQTSIETHSQNFMFSLKRAFGLYILSSCFSDGLFICVCVCILFIFAAALIRLFCVSYCILHEEKKLDPTNCCHCVELYFKSSIFSSSSDHPQLLFMSFDFFYKFFIPSFTLIFFTHRSNLVPTTATKLL